MALNHKTSNCRKKKFASSQPLKVGEFPKIFSDDDDFQDPSPSLVNSKITLTQNPLKPSNGTIRPPSKKLKRYQQIINVGKENNPIVQEDNGVGAKEFELDLLDGGLDSIESTIDCAAKEKSRGNEEGLAENGKGECFSNLKESGLEKSEGESCGEEFEGGSQLDLLLQLCEGEEEVEDCEKVSIFSDDVDFCHEGEEKEEIGDGLVCCPLCGNDITEFTDELRQVHTNECLDREGTANEIIPPHEAEVYQGPGQVLDTSPRKSPSKGVDVSPVIEWLRNLGLGKYEEVFVREEIDWGTLKWLTEEDLCGMGVVALGPRKKLVHAISELKKKGCNTVETHADVTKVVLDEINKPGANKLITDYFPGCATGRKRDCNIFKGPKEIEKSHSNFARGNQQQQQKQQSEP